MPPRALPVSWNCGTTLRPTLQPTATLNFRLYCAYSSELLTQCRGKGELLLQFEIVRSPYARQWALLVK